MPALPDVPGVIRFEVNFTVGTDAAALVRAYWSYTGGVPTPGDMAAFAKADATTPPPRAKPSPISAAHQ